MFEETEQQKIQSYWIQQQIYLFLVVLFHILPSMQLHPINKTSGGPLHKISSKKCMRLESLPNQHTPNSNLASPPLPHKNETGLSKKSQNCQSSYLKRFKIGSVRARNDTEMTRVSHNNIDPWSTPQPVFLPKDQNRPENLPQNKGRCARSFMIRKKNTSLHSKTPHDHTPKLPPHVLINPNTRPLLHQSPLLVEKIFKGEEGHNALQKQQISDTRKYKCGGSFHAISSQEEQVNLKVRPVVCREPKKINRIVSNQSQEQKGPSDMGLIFEQHMIDDSFPADQMLKKMKIVYNSRTEQSEIRKQRPQTRQGQNKHHKHRTYTGCKTIRVPWQTHSSKYYQQLQHMQTKKSKDKFIPVEYPKLTEEMFGGISMIPNEQNEGFGSRKNSMVVESLQELVLELPNDGIFSSEELKTQDLIQ